MDEALPRVDEGLARRLVLVQAIDRADTDGRLLGESEREQIELAALDASRDPARRGGIDTMRYLHERAARILAKVGQRDPRVAALQEPPAWWPWLAWLLPIAAFVLGASLDRIENPHQVNMLSPPLLAVVIWNLVLYVVLVIGVFMPPSKGGGPLDRLARHLGASRGPAHAREVAVLFHARWWQLAGAVTVQRGKRILHATAAAWGLGLALSIILGGLVREYRVGWESTLLDLPQVHALLSILFAPVVALLPFDPFTLQDLRRMSFAHGATVGVEEARRWVWMVIALLMLVVVLPRVFLAAFAAWRGRWMARGLRLDLREPYYEDILSRVSPARVVLCLLARDPAGTRLLLQGLRQAADDPRLETVAREGSWTVLRTPRDDELRIVELPRRAATELPQEVSAPLRRWLGEWLVPRAAPRAVDPLHAAREEGALVLLVAASPHGVEQDVQLLRWLGKPVLALVPDTEGAPAAAGMAADAAGDTAGAAQRSVDALREAFAQWKLPAEAVPLEAVARSWLQDKALRDVLRAHLPPTQHAGFSRIAAAWAERNERRFAQSMRVLAAQLLHAARDAQEVPIGPLNMQRVLRASVREAEQRTRQEAMDALLARLRESQSQAFVELLRLHGIDEGLAGGLESRLQDGFVMQQAIDTPQAGMAGAATGAAMGAGLDLLTGGLTLGAATALGALVGGAAAYTAAHWRNRTAPQGASQVQVSDALLQELAEAAILRYLCVIHEGRSATIGCAAVPPSWRADVVAEVEADREALARLWSEARATVHDSDVERRLAAMLQAVTGRVMARL